MGMHVRTRNAYGVGETGGGVLLVVHQRDTCYSVVAPFLTVGGKVARFTQAKRFALTYYYVMYYVQFCQMSQAYKQHTHQNQH